MVYDQLHAHRPNTIPVTRHIKNALAHYEGIGQHVKE